MTAAELLLQAIELGITSEDLDDLVHDDAEHRASSEINDGPEDEFAEEVIYSAHSNQASNINNGGLDSQIDYLLETFSAKELQEELVKLGRVKLNG